MEHQINNYEPVDNQEHTSISLPALDTIELAFEPATMVIASENISDLPTYY